MAEIYMAAAAMMISRRRWATKPVEMNIDEASTNIRTGDINNPEVFSNICMNLGSTIESAILMKAVPSSSYLHQLLLIAKEVYSRRTKFLQPWLMLLMLTLKDACQVGWFLDGDKDDLLMMENEVRNGLSDTNEMSTEQSNAHSFVSNIVSRFYPTMKVENILATLNFKAGYRTSLADFHISMDTLPTVQNLFLIVARVDSMDTSACIVRPLNVKFLINDYEVPNSTGNRMDRRPQLPSNVTKMMKNGVNRLQVCGDIDANLGQYIIAVAFMKSIPCHDPPQLQDYVPLVSVGDDSDCEIIEMPTQISLNCPISQLRIKTPVKGHLCEHRQCFDYNYFININAIRPTWKCPVCNRPVCNLDIRIDQEFLKILNEVAKGVSYVTISLDGSWLAGMAEKSTETRRRTKTQKNRVPDIDGNLTSKEASIAFPTSLDSHNSGGSAIKMVAKCPSATSITPAVSPPQVFRDSRLQSQSSNVPVHNTPPSVDGSVVNVSAERPMPAVSPPPSQAFRDSRLQSQCSNVSVHNTPPSVKHNPGGSAVKVSAERPTSAVSPSQTFKDSRLQSQSSNFPVHNTPPPVKHNSGGSSVNVSAERPTPAVSPPPQAFRDSRLQSLDSHDPIPDYNTPPSVKQTKDHLNRVNLTTTPPPNPFTKPSHPSAESQPHLATQPILGRNKTKKARTTPLFTPIQLPPSTSSTNSPESISERVMRLTRRGQKLYTPAQSRPTPVPASAQASASTSAQTPACTSAQAPASTPASNTRRVSPTRSQEPNGEMPFGIMRGSLRGTELETARLQCRIGPQQPNRANQPLSLVPMPTPTPELFLQPSFNSKNVPNLGN